MTIKVEPNIEQVSRERIFQSPITACSRLVISTNASQSTTNCSTPYEENVFVPDTGDNLPEYAIDLTIEHGIARNQFPLYRVQW